ncbi:hypothetical protein [Rubrivivax gelatinosus]|uniref:hypothetical protein n=1 Tax=Rubrivivax gelatinosus TaxID=28068 RepID=UPI0005C1A67C|nr:hypothetical protein [Rubrivivax gelatinosus]MBG6083166.1 hypothetical protein [Rubrivivax gelatinosus]
MSASSHSSQAAEAPRDLTGRARGFPDRDCSCPAAARELFEKFEVRRLDGSDAPGGKHHGCDYVVLDLVHDRYAAAAMCAYAAACRETHPQLAADLVARFGERAHTAGVSPSAAPPSLGDGVSTQLLPPELSEEDALLLAQAVDMLNEYAAELGQKGADSAAAGAECSSAAVLRLGGALSRAARVAKEVAQRAQAASVAGLPRLAEALSIADRLEREDDYHRPNALAVKAATTIRDLVSAMSSATAAQPEHLKPIAASVSPEVAGEKGGTHG